MDSESQDLEPDSRHDCWPGHRHGCCGEILRRLDRNNETLERLVSAFDQLQQADTDLKNEVAQFLTDIAGRLGSVSDPAAEDIAADIEAEVAALKAGDPALPVVNGVSPTTGSVNGGDSVTVSGSNFTGATAVSLGGVPVDMSTVNVGSDTQLTFLTPATSPGTYDLTVTGPAGTSATSAADQFTTS